MNNGIMGLTGITGKLTEMQLSAPTLCFLLWLTSRSHVFAALQSLCAVHRRQQVWRLPPLHREFTA